MVPIKTFWLEETQDVSVVLRRYRSVGNTEVSPCPAHLGMHDARVTIGRAFEGSVPNSVGDHHTHSDPRWPKHCSCGYTFAPEDPWQFIPDKLYRRSDTGFTCTRDEAPPGAVMSAPWLKDSRFHQPGDDGLVILIKLPTGSWWSPDGPSIKDGIRLIPNAWKRTGRVPDLTVHPSILSPNWHGWLVNGYLQLTPPN